MPLSSPPGSSRRSDKNLHAVTRDTTRLQRMLSTIREERAGVQLSDKARVLERDSSDEEHAAVDLANALPLLHVDERAVLSTPLADTSSLNFTLKPSFDLQWIKSELYDKFTCELCTNIIASPYSLKASECKHAFCAICLLRWIFKDFRDGAWSSPIKCPSCTTTIPSITMQTPRDPMTFPLVPNHVALKMLHAYITVLSDAADTFLYSFSDTERTALEDVDDDTLAWGWAMPGVRDLRTREREGQDFLSELRDNWADANAVAFASYKDFVGYDPHDSAVPTECDEISLAADSDHHLRGNVSAHEDNDEGGDDDDIGAEANDSDRMVERDEDENEPIADGDGGVQSDDKEDGVEYDDEYRLCSGPHDADNHSGTEQCDDEDGGIVDGVDD
ncbi:hypothetical protein OH76DRAFT_1487964 [Lentinus brumalis]|uniref:RING-type domain-containing protein n=1 Tax=Lentinus brumalis TaxID=2498619 RepID=A0A371CSK8_9APHY|nr:hypothetical protein OH76DRAFT_1487964 [Polyporus brumalis]